MKKILVLICFLNGISMISAGQAFKAGHINSAELLALMPESKVADADLKKYGETLDAQLKAMGAEYQAKIQEYQSKESLMAEAIKTVKQKEIMDLETRIGEFQEQGQQDIQRKKEELYSPILKKAQEAINAIAKEGNYHYIFDTSLGSILYAMDGNDISGQVKKKLGISATSETPAEGTTTKPEAPKK